MLDLNIILGDGVPGYQLLHVVALSLAEVIHLGSNPEQFLIIQLFVLLWYVMLGIGHTYLAPAS